MIAHFLAAREYQTRYFQELSWVEQQMGPYRGYDPTPYSRDWYVIAATLDFLARSEAERVLLAEAHFEAHVRFWATRVGDADEYRRWFIRSAAMSLSEAPIKTWQGNGQPYRAFPPDDIPRRSVARLWFAPDIVLIAGVLAVGGTAILMLLTAAAIWVARGFRVQ